MSHRIKQKWGYTVLTFLLIAIAFLPFLTVYHLKHSVFFISVIGIICFITMVFSQWILRLISLAFVYFFTLYYYFPNNKYFGLTWFTSFLHQLQTVYLNGYLGTIPAKVALTLILFVIIILITLMIHYEKWIFSYLFSIGYLFSLVLVNRLQVEWRILSITSVAFLFYIWKNQPIQLTSKNKRKLFLSVAGLCLFLSLNAIYVPLFFPDSKSFFLNQTTSFRQFLHSKGVYQQLNNYGISSATKTGFSENDKQLGGPVTDDSSIVFTATQAEVHYWRVETKQFYTGKGWIATSDTKKENTPITLENSEFQGRFDEEIAVSLSFNTMDTYLPIPYGKVHIPSIETNQLNISENKNRLDFTQRPKELTLTFEKPNYTEENLQLVNLSVPETLESTIQLPETVPKRVKELALTLTKSEDTLYGKVKNIENYLKANADYRYSKIDAVYTKENMDYVDQFLFETKIGYCDNFSSAMVILLRAVGIPSRWAKGFSASDSVEESSAASSTKKYAIRNSNAHSWPEVYFEGYGWIPFEPTPGFNSLDETTTSDQTQETDSKDSQTATSLSSSANETSSSSSTATSSSKPVKQQIETPNANKWIKIVPITLFLIALLLVSLFLYKNFFWLYFMIHRNMPTTTFYTSYMLLLKKAEKKLHRNSNEPLNQYALRFEKKYPHCQNTFTQLTTFYEAALYNAQLPNKADYNHLLIHMAKVLNSLKK